jgi:hypothetical protein
VSNLFHSPRELPEATHFSARAHMLLQNPVFDDKITCVTHSLNHQFQAFDFPNDFFLPFVEEEFFVVVKVLLATVTADKMSTAAIAIIPK